MQRHSNSLICYQCQPYYDVGNTDCTKYINLLSLASITWCVTIKIKSYSKYLKFCLIDSFNYWQAKTICSLIQTQYQNFG